MLSPDELALVQRTAEKMVAHLRRREGKRVNLEPVKLLAAAMLFHVKQLPADFSDAAIAAIAQPHEMQDMRSAAEALRNSLDARMDAFYELWTQGWVQFVEVGGRIGVKLTQPTQIGGRRRRGREPRGRRRR